MHNANMVTTVICFMLECYFYWFNDNNFSISLFANIEYVSAIRLFEGIQRADSDLVLTNSTELRKPLLDHLKYIILLQKNLES